jgi:putative hydrolase of the HAD superfamily
MPSNNIPSSSMKIIFFDIGGVLLSNGWGHESRQKAAAHFGIDYTEMDVLHNFIFNVYEIGKLTLDDYLNTVVFHKERNFSSEDFKQFMYSQSSELPGMLSWLKQWKHEHHDFPIISINNEGRELNDFRINKFNLHQCFDAFISSCHVGMRKPDPGIFNLALGIAQVQPEQCIYFDDRPMLVQAAQRLGINSFQHQGLESTKAILNDFISTSKKNNHDN